MKIDIENVVKLQKYNGQKLWVCDYRKESTNKKAIRNVTPTQVYIATSDDYTNANVPVPTVYYSNVVLVGLKNNGEPNFKKIIRPYDNTGYRSYTGIGINIFDNEQECIDFYNNQVQMVIEMYEIEIKTIVSQLEKELEIIKEMKK